MAVEKTVKASKPGFYNGPRNVGDVFKVPATLNGSWFTEVSPAKAAPVASGKVAVSNDEDLA